jgi:hypothetical protein
MKPIMPSHVGLWRASTTGDAFSLSLGFRSDVPGGQELMGWSIIPAGLVLGGAFAMITWLYSRWSLRRLAAVSRPVGV